MTKKSNLLLHWFVKQFLKTQLFAYSVQFKIIRSRRDKWNVHHTNRIIKSEWKCCCLNSTLWLEPVCVCDIWYLKFIQPSFAHYHHLRWQAAAAGLGNAARKQSAKTNSTSNPPAGSRRHWQGDPSSMSPVIALTWRCDTLAPGLEAELGCQKKPSSPGWTSWWMWRSRVCGVRARLPWQPRSTTRVEVPVHTLLRRKT